MKRIALSSSLIVLGAWAAQADPAASLSKMESTKPWSAALTLRGFYDDNYNTSPVDERDSFGILVKPQISINIPLEQTLLSASYIYTFTWFEDRSAQDLKSVDHTHQFDLSLVHQFSERYMIDLRDSFVVAQEPELLDEANPFRTQGNNIRNSAFVGFNAQLTPIWSLFLGYNNTYIDYEDENGDFTAPSRSGTLDRMIQGANVDLRWQASRTTVGIIGYQFETVCYTQNEEIGLRPVAPPFIFSTDRNSRTHRAYLGGEHTFNPSFGANAKLGVEFTDYYNDPLDPDTAIGPYAEASLSYDYSAAGSTRLSLRHSRYQTDVFQSDANGNITQDQDVTSLVATINHSITPKLMAEVSGRGQFSTFNGGASDGDSEQYLGVDVELSYHFNQHLSAQAGYRYSMNCSDESLRSYDRNIYYVGLTAAY